MKSGTEYGWVLATKERKVKMDINIGTVYDHDFYCTCCGRKGIPIGRDRGRNWESGHLKKLFCVYCKKETNHAETIENSYYDKSIFFDEFKSRNFDINGNRIIPLKEWSILYYGTAQKIG